MMQVLWTGDLICLLGIILSVITIGFSHPEDEVFNYAGVIFAISIYGLVLFIFATIIYSIWL